MIFDSAAFRAMEFARRVHAGQVRKYTGNPYADHLAEVAGIAMTVGWHYTDVHPDNFMAVCWLHDCVEDQGVSLQTIEREFGTTVAIGVSGLTDVETGNRAQRKAAARDRLAACSGWIQTIKVADLISNTASIVKHDPKFARVYLAEKRALLDVLTKAHGGLLQIAREQLEAAERQLADLGDPRWLPSPGPATAPPPMLDECFGCDAHVYGGQCPNCPA